MFCKIDYWQLESLNPEVMGEVKRNNGYLYLYIQR